ncbi:DUF1983 domain-containing protein [Salmonella enterica]|nr:DUF1983 domain-containing protein [Salmonella enterica]EBR3094913.1 DUF1983 domain-containing protein [Salmonella enterica]EDZ1674414.1 DUF1983 domain-containing protein [Salmonella enterica]EEK6025201.1 DUF1983 domain-containing protein [Salmonella enterica]
MRALLTPEIAPRMGVVLFRPGSELMPLFMQGRVLLEPEPEQFSSFASGVVPAVSQPLADDPAVRDVFRNESVIYRAGGLDSLESWLLRGNGCQWPHSDWHSEQMTTMRHAPGAIRLCWHCDNLLREQFTERLESIAVENTTKWVLSVVCRDLGFDDMHAVTLPELCWWMVRNDLADVLPESAARKALRMPKAIVQSATRESEIVPSVPATSLVQDIGTTWTSNQLQAGHTYYWYIRTINAFGASAFVEVPALCSMDTGELMDLIDDGIQKSDAFQNVKDGVDTNLEGIMENSLANHGTVEHQYQQYGEVRADILVVKTTVATAEKGLADLSTYVQAQIGPEGSLTSAVNQKMTAEVNSDGTAKASYTLNMGIVRNGVKYNTGFGMSIEPSGNSYKSTVVFAADQFGIYSGNNPGNWQAAFFVYNGQVFIRSALIQEASIDFAKITDSLQSANFIPGGGGRGWSLPKSGSPEFHGKLYADSGEFAFNGVNNVTRIDGNGITVNLSGGGRVVVGRWT